MMSKPAPLPPLSQAQLEIMNIVWERGDVTVADVWKALSDHRKVARNTILTMLTRLEEKGWLKRDAQAHAHRYCAAVPRDATMGTLIKRLVETTFGGSAEGLVMALLQGRGVSKQEAARIRLLIDKAEGQRRRRS
jgi:BlaI family penicillinase repressor